MTGHGHVFPNPNGSKARCGGPRLCDECAEEAGRRAAWVIEQEQTPEAAYRRAQAQARELLAAVDVPLKEGVL